MGHAFFLCWQVEGLELIIDDLVGSTGLELKVDPGIPYVYAGFGGRLLEASFKIA